MLLSTGQPTICGLAEDYLRVDEAFLGQAVEEVTCVLRGRVPFNDSLSAEGTLDPCYI